MTSDPAGKAPAGRDSEIPAGELTTVAPEPTVRTTGAVVSNSNGNI